MLYIYNNVIYNNTLWLFKLSYKSFYLRSYVLSGAPVLLASDQWTQTHHDGGVFGLQRPTCAFGGILWRPSWNLLPWRTLCFLVLQDASPSWRRRPVSRDRLSPKRRPRRGSFRKDTPTWRRWGARIRLKTITHSSCYSSSPFMGCILHWFCKSYQFSALGCSLATNVT